MSDFTTKEKYWYDKICETKQKLEEYNASGDISKSDLNFLSNYIKLMEYSLKFENLRPAEHMSVCKRVVRIYKTFTPNELKNFLVDFVLLDGLYVVTDVMFIDSRIYKEYTEYPLEIMRQSLGLPDDLQCGTLKSINIDNREFGVGLMKTPMVENHIYNASNWDYLIWE